MNNIVEFLKGKKTYIIATLMVFVAVINLATGTESFGQLLQDPNLLVLANGLGLASVRAAIAKLVV